MQFRPATRQGVKPIIGLYSESGCGKTYSSLLLARGIVGPQGKIGMIDTESGRGDIYADVIPGGYETLPLGEPFSPDRYVEAIRVAESTGFTCLIIDSISHGWEGLGGVLDQAGKIEESSGKAGLHCWRKPKLEHQKMMLKLLQTPLIIICCLRAKHKSRQGRNPQTGKTEIIKEEFCTPIQAEDFIFEMTAHAEILQDHTIRLTKCAHPDLGKCFPEDYKEPLKIEHGERIMEWCQNPRHKPKQEVPMTHGPTVITTANPPIIMPEKGSREDILSQIVKERPIGMPKKWIQVESWLVGLGIMADTETLQGSSDERLKEILTQLSKK